ncbi:MAG: hypothetical protein IJ643_11715 [Eubacterium sp.]|nr:hypothetical protein [Eubacterium sp.]MBR1761912.1 hypothetical protein [Eubacterium sp.]
MARKVNPAGGVTENTAPKFPIEKLREECIALFGVSSATFDGATVGLSGEYTVEDIKTKINDWLKKPIKGGM